MKQMEFWSVLISPLAAVALVLGTASEVAVAATEVQKWTAIEEGVEWLVQQQQTDGRFLYGGGNDDYDCAATGAALRTLLEAGYRPGSDIIINATNYGDVIGDGLRFIFSRATTYAISIQLHGDPDTNGNGLGVKFVPGGNNSRDMFVTGVVLPAIVATGTPDELVNTGGLAGWTYQQVVEDTIDYFAFGQNENVGYSDGGWRYYANFSASDQACSLWPVVSMLSAREWGIYEAGFVEGELDKFMSHIQNTDGGCWYTPHSGYSNVHRTGNFLIQSYYTGNPVGDTTVQAALNYINNQWQSTTCYDGNFGVAGAMWSTSKGLEYMVGLDDTTYITNLHAPGTMDPGDTWTWSEDYCEYLVTNQQADGHWNTCGYFGVTMGTSFSIDILKSATVCASVTGDWDYDDDVDLEDFAEFEGCITGPGGGTAKPRCVCVDFDGDADVDLEDFAEFQAAFTGSLP